jgi:hypothetical protein
MSKVEFCQKREKVDGDERERVKK